MGNEKSDIDFTYNFKTDKTRDEKSSSSGGSRSWNFSTRQNDKNTTPETTSRLLNTQDFPSTSPASSVTSSPLSVKSRAMNSSKQKSRHNSSPHYESSSSYSQVSNLEDKNLSNSASKTSGSQPVEGAHRRSPVRSHKKNSPQAMSPEVSRRKYLMSDHFSLLEDRVKVTVRVRPLDLNKWNNESDSHGVNDRNATATRSPRATDDDTNQDENHTDVGDTRGADLSNSSDRNWDYHSSDSALEYEHEGKVINVFKRDGPVYWHTFSFDAILGPAANQENVYTSTAVDVVDNVLNGYNGTIIAYGQTGAGKTYTIMNMAQNAVGIIPRAAAEIFIKAKRNANEYSYRISMTCVQIYMDNMQDLLNPDNDHLVIREGAKEVYLAGATCVELESLEQCLILLTETERNRVFASTKLNEVSSRSHVVVMLKVERKSKKPRSSNRERPKAKSALDLEIEGDSEMTSSSNDDKSVIGKLFLVDLAGSERLKKSGSEGLRASEARSINSSLYFLGKCIKARAENNSDLNHQDNHHHVPFRESKLTRLLQESLSGNAKVSLIINVHSSSSHAEETISSLMFGARAMQVDTRATINESLPNMPNFQQASDDVDYRFSGVTQDGEIAGKMTRFELTNSIGDSETMQALLLSAERRHAIDRDEWKKEKAALIAASHRSETEWQIRVEEQKEQRRVKVKESQSALKDSLHTVAMLNDKVKLLERTIAAMVIQKFVRNRKSQQALKSFGKDLSRQRKLCLTLAKQDGLLLIKQSLSMLHDANVAMSTYFLLPQKVRTNNLHLEEAARFNG